MKKEHNLQEPQKQALNIPIVSSSYICTECGTEHKVHELKMADNGWVYEKVCLDKLSNLPQLLIANFLIHFVMCSTVN